MSDPVSDLMSDPVSDLISDPVSDPVSDPASDLMSDPVSDLISDTVRIRPRRTYPTPVSDPGVTWPVTGSGYTDCHGTRIRSTLAG